MRCVFEQQFTNTMSREKRRTKLCRRPLSLNLYYPRILGTRPKALLRAFCTRKSQRSALDMGCFWRLDLSSTQTGQPGQHLFSVVHPRSRLVHHSQMHWRLGTRRYSSESTGLHSTEVRSRTIFSRWLPTLRAEIFQICVGTRLKKSSYP